MGIGGRIAGDDRALQGRVAVDQSDLRVIQAAAERGGVPADGAVHQAGFGAPFVEYRSAVIAGAGGVVVKVQLVRFTTPPNVYRPPP